MDAAAIIGRNVKRLRAARGFSQEQLAARLGTRSLGVTQDYISKLEAGRKNPTLKTLAAIAEALEVSVSVLTEGA